MSITISNSKANCYLRCPRRYMYQYVRGLRPKSTALPLKRGDWLHQLIMHHYDGNDWREPHNQLAAEFNRLLLEEREQYGDLPTECGRIMESYVRHYAEEDRGWRVVDSELDEVIDLPTGDKFRFIIDLIVKEADGGVWLVDHKTVGKFMDEDFMVIDAQLARYFWAARKLGIKSLRGVMFNEIITTSPTVPTLLKSGELTKRKNLACDAETYLARIEELGLDPDDYADILERLRGQSNRWFRRTRLARDDILTKQLMRELLMTCGDIKRAELKNRFPRAPRKDCRWDCSFLELCQVELFGGDTELIVKHKFKTKDK